MKQIVTSLLAALFIISCTKQPIDKEISINSLEETPSTFVSQEEAINSLNEFLDEFEQATKGGASIV